MSFTNPAATAPAQNNFNFNGTLLYKHKTYQLAVEEANCHHGERGIYEVTLQLPNSTKAFSMYKNHMQEWVSYDSDTCAELLNFLGREIEKYNR